MRILSFSFGLASPSYRCGLQWYSTRSADLGSPSLAQPSKQYRQATGTAPNSDHLLSKDFGSEPCSGAYRAVNLEFIANPCSSTSEATLPADATIQVHAAVWSRYP
jgi:hypothetical protein